MGEKMKLGIIGFLDIKSQLKKLAKTSLYHNHHLALAMGILIAQRLGTKHGALVFANHYPLSLRDC